MNKAYALISAAAVAAVMAAPAVAQDLPINSAVSGGQGDVQLDGQAVSAAALGLSGSVVAVAVVAAVTVITVVSNDDNEVSTTTTTGS